MNLRDVIEKLDYLGNPEKIEVKEKSLVSRL